MLKKISILMFALLMLTLLTSNITQAQKRSSFPAFSIAPVLGVNFPLGDLGNVYKVGFNGGADFMVNLNRETAFFLKVGYYLLPNKQEIDPNGTNASMIEISAGPRYTFTNPKVKAELFFEAGLGAYMFMYKDKVVGNVTTTYESETLFGINGGPGALIPMGKMADFMVKAKAHYIFQKNGSRVIATGVMGVAFKL